MRSNPETAVANLAIKASLPCGLQDSIQLRYVVRQLLSPYGLRVDFQESAELAGQCRLSWPGLPDAAAVPVELSELRDAFSIISGRREFDVPRDRLNRVSASALGVDCSQPVLSSWARRLVLELGKIDPRNEISLPRPRVYLTHDIDRVHPLEPMGMLGRFARAARGAVRGDSAGIKDLGRWLHSAVDFADTFEEILRCEHEAGAVGTCFFMSGPYSLRRYGARSGRGKRLCRAVRKVESHGHRPGLHGCVYSLDNGNYASQRTVLSQAAGREITWHRNHYLVWEPSKSPSLLQEAGIRVDSTCGFHDCNGFRAGLAHEYRLWDWQANAPSRVVEIPLVFMDDAYKGRQEDEWEQLYKRLEAAFSVVAGVAVLFHMDHFVLDRREIRKYRALLAWLNDRGAVLDAAPENFDSFAEGSQ